MNKMVPGIDAQEVDPMSNLRGYVLMKQRKRAQSNRQKYQALKKLEGGD